MRILILGGSTEASALARLIAGRADIEATLSLAGRTAQPAASPIASRSGGFGGTEGLVAYLTRERVAAVIDATHPFAAQMTRHAREACASLSLPLLVLTRAPWAPLEGDRWIEVEDAVAAVAALGATARRVFLTVGRLSVPAFAAAPQHHYLIRSIDAPQGLDALPHHELLLARPPFSFEDERRAMLEGRVDIVVSKNSGGEATYAKIAAARELALPVVMIRRPKSVDWPAGPPALHDPEAALAWIAAHRETP
ncbi:precorrin-6A reductase [Rhizobiales bacterium GAS191]|nr:precorrin-6A reductase [Rhizobiales bacterium GAS113]SEC00845.1 precorrin-6A reductase [Rhizobiales bacterium GAS191]SED18001.1 precorrin-6A reductase [Rhizobiales bacterium GAS188]